MSEDTGLASGKRRNLGMRSAVLSLAGLAMVATALVLFDGPFVSEQLSSGSTDQTVQTEDAEATVAKAETSSHMASKAVTTAATSGPVVAAEPGQGNVNSELKSAPHLVFFMVDDQGYNDVGYNSNDLSWATPFIDKMAARGVKLDRYYTMHLCTPARSALMTGMYPIHTGMAHDVIQPSAPWGLPLEFDTMPQYLKKAGYLTHMVGKWHLGFYNESFIPTSRGFETYTGYFGDQEHYLTHKYDRTMEDKNSDSHYFYDFIRTKPDNTFELIAEQDGIANVSSSEVFCDEAERVLEANKDAGAPLFLYMAWQNVHGPLDMVTPEWLKTNIDQDTLDTLHAVPMRTRRHFAALSLQVDKSIEMVYMHVEKTIGLENTLFLYASDNGGCKDAGGYNSPLRGGKHFLYEGGVRVPAFISGKILPSTAGGSLYKPIFHVSDWLPTMFGLIDDSTGDDYSSVVGMGALDGANHWSQLKQAATVGYSEGARDEIILNIDRWHTPDCISGDDDEYCTENLEPTGFSRGAVIRGEFKFILNEYENSWFAPETETEWDSTGEADFSSTGRAIQDCTQDYSNPIRSKLFNITADPYEQNNLLTDLPEVASEFQKYLEEKEVSKPAWQPSFPAEASSVWEKSSHYLVPWCELECKGTHLSEGDETWAARS